MESLRLAVLLVQESSEWGAAKGEAGGGVEEWSHMCWQYGEQEHLQ